MSRMAVIDNGIVENIIEAEEGFEIEGKELVLASEGVDIGGAYANGVFTPPEYHEPPPVTPDSVSARQFKLQLLAAGLLDQVETWIATQDQGAQLAYANSGSFVRGEPMMQIGFAALGFSPEQIDAFFLAASLL